MPANVPVIPQLLTLEAVARAFCVSPHTVRAWVKKGKLRPIRLCRRVLSHPDEVARFLAAAKCTEAQHRAPTEDAAGEERKMAVKIGLAQLILPPAGSDDGSIDHAPTAAQSKTQEAVDSVTQVIPTPGRHS